MQHDYRKELPVRFARAVKAFCGTPCIFPECGCTGMPSDVERAITAWEDLPLTNGQRDAAS